MPTKEMRKARKALRQALIWLSAAGLALARDGTVSELEEADRLANDTGVLLKKIGGQNEKRQDSGVPR